jgi:hypothetical protein
MGLKKLLLSFIVTFIAFSATAQKIGGAEIYYRKIGVDKYLVTAHVYRICSEAPLNNLTMFAKADSFNIGMSMKRIHIEKIPDTCGNPCNLQNQVSNFGFEKHTFIDTVDFNKAQYKLIQQANLCEVRFAIHQKIRHLPSNATYTFGDSMFYLDAMINRCNNFSSYNSPEFSIEPKFKYLSNITSNYSPGPIDTLDFDSLSFELAPAMLNDSTPVVYNTPFTYLFPINTYCPPNPSKVDCRPIPNARPARGFFYDNRNCVTIFLPTSNNQNSTVKYLIKEWRYDSNGINKVIGYVSREMTLSINTSTYINYPPNFEGGIQFAICQNDKICLNVRTNDDPFLPYQTIPDTVSVIWDHGIPMGTVRLLDSNSREKTMEFCWKTKLNDNPSVYYFTVKAIDQACNVFLSSQTYIIGVRPTALFTKTSSMDSCNVVSYTLTPEIQSINNFAYVQVFDSKNKLYYTSTKWNDKITLNKNDTFIIKYMVSNQQFNCPTYLHDTIVPKNAFERGFIVSSTDTNVCYSYPAQLSFSPNQFKNLKTFEWFINDSNIMHLDSVFNFDIYQKTKISLKLTDNRNCQSEAYRNFIPFQANTNPFVNTKIYICKPDSITLTANLSNIQSPYTSTWKFKNIDTTFIGNSLKLLTDTNTKVYIDLIDHRHCMSNDSIEIVYNLNLDSLVLDQQLTCMDSIVTITAKTNPNNTISSFKWLIDGVDTIHNSYTLKLPVKKKHTITFASINSNNCKSTDSLSIQFIRNPEGTLFISDTQVCRFDSLHVHVDSLKNFNSLSWYFNNNPLNYQSSSVLFSPDSSGILKLKINNQNLCFSEKTISINLFPQTNINILTDTFYNSKNLIYLSLDQKLNHYNWFNGSTKDTTYYWAYQFGAPGKHKIWINGFDTNFCAVSDTVDIYTDRFVSINKFNNGIFKIYPNPSNGMVNIFCPNDDWMQIYDSKSAMIYERKLVKGLNSVELHTLPSGIYSIVINQFKQTLVIQH